MFVYLCVLSVFVLLRFFEKTFSSIYLISLPPLPPQSSEDEDFGASGADDDEEDDEDAGSDVGSLDSGARPKEVLKGVRKQRPSRIQCRGKKQLRRRRRHSSEEEEEESEEEMGECRDFCIPVV